MATIRIRQRTRSTEYRLGARRGGAKTTSMQEIHAMIRPTGYPEIPPRPIVPEVPRPSPIPERPFPPAAPRPYPQPPRPGRPIITK